METLPRAPAGITNIPLWEEHCRKIHARAKDLIEGKLSVLNAAVAIERLVFPARAGTDADLLVFKTISHETIGLPIGPERQYWSEEALRREDQKIHALEERWKLVALASAQRLIERYSWALDARRLRRRSDHDV